MSDEKDDSVQGGIYEYLDNVRVWPHMVVAIVFIFIVVVVLDEYAPGVVVYVESAHYFGLALILLAGVVLYVFRRLARFYYGALEVGFALFAAWFAISKVEASGYSETTAIVAAIYFIVRGIDNMWTGAEEDQLKNKAKESVE